MYFRVRGTAKIRCGIRETLTGYELELLSGKWEAPNLNTDAWLGKKTKCGIATTLGMRDSREKRAGMPDFPTLYATKLFYSQARYRRNPRFHKFYIIRKLHSLVLVDFRLLSHSAFPKA